jgi:lysine 2,3-aminomutase
MSAFQPQSAAQHPMPSASDLAHRVLRDGEFWRTIPAYKDVDEATFLNHIWQGQHSVKTPQELLATIEGLVPAGFIDDVNDGFHRAPMAVRVSPYMIASIDWTKPELDPIRTQFIPLGSRLRPDHPMLTLDSLHEQEDAPVPGLTHRYHDKALFLPLNICPVYCRFCTRSYAIGSDTDVVDKVDLHIDVKRWQAAFAYIASRPELEDIVISGGDAYQLSPKNITLIGESLLAIEHVRRLRFATKGLAVMPSKVLTDHAWLDALTGVVEHGRKLGKDVVVHTHFNNPNEISVITQRAANELFQRGITVRNQTVLIRGVNDTFETMLLLIRRLSYLNIHPYYVYMHDLVRGVEDLRTPLSTALELEKKIRGATAGFNTPLFVCDAPGGGGKRDAHSFEYYDHENGISVFTAPSVKPGECFFYYDPIDSLSDEAQARWKDPENRRKMIENAREKALTTR